MYEIDATDLENQGKRLGQFDEIAGANLHEAMQKSVVTVQSLARQLAPVGVSGAYRNSIVSEVVQEDAATIVGKIGSNLSGEVYPAVIEFGRAPGAMPPPQALERWVQLKLRVPAKQVKGVAFTVARKIAARGIPAKRVLGRGLEYSLAAIQAFFEQAARKTAEALTK